jgi:hypothetical protein
VSVVPDVTLQDLYALAIREFGGSDYLDLDQRGVRWVMDLDAYKQVRAAARAAGAIYPDDAADDPSPEDRLFGLPVDVRDGGGAPHLEPGG